jgi:rRNA maturation RNase YbeY
MKILIANRQRRIPLRTGTYRTWGEKVLRKLGRPEAEISLSFLNDRRIRSLNKIYRGKDRPTDVLAFPLALSRSVRWKGAAHTPPPLFLGDVVISVPTARRQAREYRHSLGREMARLMIHGILHLLGYDHEKADEARRMRRKERTLIRHVFESPSRKEAAC